MRRLSNRERKRLSEELGIEIREKEIYEEKIGKVTLYLFGKEKKPLLARYKNKLIPTFYFRDLIERLPRVVIDEGAANALRRGANLMAPGVIERPNPERGSLVLVVDKKGMYVGIGEAIVKDLPEKGVVVLMYHVISERDAISNAIKILKGRSS